MICIDFIGYLSKPEWGTGECNEGNDGNAEKQGGNAGNQGGNVENRGGNAGNQGGNAGNIGNRFGMRRMTWNRKGKIKVYKIQFSFLAKI